MSARIPIRYPGRPEGLSLGLVGEGEVRGGITVRPHVQRAADGLEVALGQELSFGTYPGHSPPEGPTQALDIFNPDNAAGYGLQDKVCAWLMANARRLGVRYVNRREHIWNIERAAEGWRRQTFHGDRTADHYDHVHVTFYATAPAIDDPVVPAPSPALKGAKVFIYSTAPNVDKGSIWFVFDGKAHRLHLPADVQRLIDKGTVNYGEMSQAFHNLFDHVG